MTRQAERQNKPAINTASSGRSLYTVCNGLVWPDIITNNRIKTWGCVLQKQAHSYVCGATDANKKKGGGMEPSGWGEVMIIENKKATVVRPLLRPAPNYAHRQTSTWGLPIWPSGCC